MKIGIITYHEADNCGAVLQAYALQNTVKELNANSKIEIIDYRKKYIEKSYSLIRSNRKNMITFVKSIILSFFLIKTKLIKKMKFVKFRKCNLILSRNVYRKPENISGYDYYIAGSDQIWNPEISKFDDALFLSFVKNDNKKISYAASIGKNELSEIETNFIKSNINNIDCISVRENRAIEIINQLSNSEVVRVLDPTFLVERQIWVKKFVKKDIKKRYLLLYMVSENVEANMVAESVSKVLNIDVWHINDSIKASKYGFKSIKGVGPREFIELIYNAEFVVTSSFHGTAFSIIFNKNFITVPYEKTSSRMIDLLSVFNLQARIMFNRIQMSKQFSLEVDYSIANLILTNEREKSIDFLAQALGVFESEQQYE